MSIYTTPEFWRGASERAIKTFCHSLLAVLTTGVVGIAVAEHERALSAAALATLVSLLTSLSQAEFTAGAPAFDAQPDGYDPRHRADVADSKNSPYTGG